MGLANLVAYSQDAFASFDLPSQLMYSEDRRGRLPEPPWLRETMTEPNYPRLVDLNTDVSLFDIPAEGWSPPLGGSPPSNIDELAFYLPFHFYRERWGIYIRANGILTLAAYLKRRRLYPDDGGLVQMCRDVLLEHERLHFMAEVAAARAELVVRSKIYHAYFHLRQASLEEEALANAWALERAGQANWEQALRDWMDGQGPGYRDYATIVSVEDAQRSLIRHLLSQQHVDFSARTLGPVDFLFDNSSRLSVPVRIVIDPAYPIGRGRPFPKAFSMKICVHTEEHPPPHYHIFMPPNVPYTRYEWPAHAPLDGDPKLSNAEEKKRLQYWSRYGKKIEEKLRAVFRPP